MQALAVTVLVTCLCGESLPPAQYQNTPVFNIRSKPVNGDDVSDILLEYYDERRSRWVGYGLFVVSRMADGSVRARISFRAPYEGTFRLRTVATDRAGNIEALQDDPGSAKMIAVYDATPPVVEMIFPRGGEQVSAPGTMTIRWMAHDHHISWGEAVQVLFSQDGGVTYSEILPWSDLAEQMEYTLPDITTYRAVVKVRVKDRAGNVGEKESGLFSVLGSKRMETVKPEPQVITPSPEPPRARLWEELPAPARRVEPMSESRRMAQRAYTRGVIYLVRGDYDEAVNELTDALQHDPDFLPARIDLGVALVQEGRVKDALEFFHNSIRRYPHSADLAYNAAVIYHRAGDIEEALRLLSRTIRLDPDRIDALWLAAECATILGRLDDAVHWWLRIVELTSPANRYYQKSLAYLEKAGVDTRRIEKMRGPELITAPAPAAPSPGVERKAAEKGKTSIQGAIVPEETTTPQSSSQEARSSHHRTSRIRAIFRHRNGVSPEVPGNSLW